MEVNRKFSVFGMSDSAVILLTPPFNYLVGGGEFKGCSMEGAATLTAEDACFMNAALDFFVLDSFIRTLKLNGVTRIYCVSLDPVPGENLSILKENDVPVILYGLTSLSELSECRRSIEHGRKYYSPYTGTKEAGLVCCPVQRYKSLTWRQKEAFQYIMTGRSQKEFQIECGYNTLPSAAVHWRAVLGKFNVRSVNELLGLFH